MSASICRRSRSPATISPPSFQRAEVERAYRRPADAGADRKLDRPGPVRAQRVFEALKALDATVAMDDFGTGYSSLAYLQRLPIDVLKIDRSFVTGMMVDPDSVAIVRAVLSLAEALGMSTTAEGIETVSWRRPWRPRLCVRPGLYSHGRSSPRRRSNIGRIAAATDAVADIHFHVGVIGPKISAEYNMRKDGSADGRRPASFAQAPARGMSAHGSACSERRRSARCRQTAAHVPKGADPDLRIAAVLAIGTTSCCRLSQTFVSASSS